MAEKEKVIIDVELDMVSYESNLKKINELNDELARSTQKKDKETFREREVLIKQLAKLEKNNLALEQKYKTSEDNKARATKMRNDMSSMRKTYAIQKKYNTRMANEQMKNASKVAKFRERIATVGASYGAYQAITQGLALVGGALRQVTTQAFETDSALRKINTILKVGEDQLWEYEDALRKIAKDTGVSFTETLEGAYEALSTGIKGKDLKDFMQTANELAVGGFTTTAKAVDGLTTVLSAYGLEADRATAISDVFIKGQEDGKFVIDELSGALSKVIPTTSALGVGIEDVVGAFVQLTLDGKSATEASTQINRMFLELADSGSELSKILFSKTNKSFRELVSEGTSTAEVLKIIDSASKEANIPITDLTNNIRTQGAIFSLFKGDVEGYDQAIQNLYSSQGATAKASEEAGKSLERQQTKFKETWNDLITSDVVTKAFGAGFEWATKFLEGIQQTLDEGGFFKLMGKAGRLALQPAQSLGRAIGSKIGEGVRGGFDDFMSNREQQKAGVDFIVKNELIKEYGKKAGEVYAEAMINGANSKTAQYRAEVFARANNLSATSTSATEGGSGDNDDLEAELALKAHKKRLLEIQKEYDVMKLKWGNATSAGQAQMNYQYKRYELNELIRFTKGKEALEGEHYKHVQALRELDFNHQVSLQNAKMKLAEEEARKDIRNKTQLIRYGQMYAKAFKGTSEETLANIVKITGQIVANEGTQLIASGVKDFYIGRAKMASPATLAQGTIQTKRGKDEMVKGSALAGAGIAMTAVGDSALAGGSDSEESDDYQDPTEVSEDITEEQEECSFTVIQGMEAFTQAFDQYLKDHHNMSVTTKLYAKRR